MSTSQNGYPVLFTNDPDGALPRLRKWVIPGTNRHIYMRDGSTGFLLAHFLLWFHEKVERIDIDKQWDDWGWAVRAIRGQDSGYSNHASGTAFDVNALQHPLGVRGTYTPQEVNMIHRRLKLYRGCIFGGLDYQNRPDEMHFEIARDIKSCERIAKLLAATPRGQRILKANPGARKVIWS